MEHVDLCRALATANWHDIDILVEDQNVQDQLSPALNRLIHKGLHYPSQLEHDIQAMVSCRTRRALTKALDRPQEREKQRPRL